MAAASGNVKHRRASEVVIAQENMKVLAAANAQKKEEWSMVSTSAGCVADKRQSIRVSSLWACVLCVVGSARVRICVSANFNTCARCK